jgi:hypothetical protein
VIGVLVARAIDQGIVDREIPAERRIEVRGDVRVGPVDPRVDDADEDVRIADLHRVRAVCRRVDHVHVPLKTGKRFLVGLDSRCGRRSPGRDQGLDVVDLLAEPGLGIPDDPVARGTRECSLTECIRQEIGVRRLHLRDADVRDLVEDSSAERSDRRPGLRRRDAVPVLDDVLAYPACAVGAGRNGG